jgi:succinate dehydrogenase / fumarate reductase flavoprotein subunit
MTVAPHAPAAPAAPEAPEAPERPAAPTGRRWQEAPGDGPALDGHLPASGVAVGDVWDQHKFDMKLINPANRRRYHVIVVGSGLAGAAAAASLGELGYRVSCFCYQDSPRRAHSIAAQGGINAAKNYRNDGDSIYRLFYDTVKGGDYRSREANVYRLAQLSVNIIDQCVAQGVPFAREYGGLLDNRSFGGAQVSRTFYARGQTGQQLLLGAYQALARQIHLGAVTMYPRTEMLDLVMADGAARGIVTRDLITGSVESHVGDAVILATGGYGNVFHLSTNAKGCNATAIWRAHRRGALLANPCFTQIHPTCIPVAGDYQSKLTLMSESLRNDGRIWVPLKAGDTRPPDQIPEAERDYYLERKYPSFGNLVPRDIASRNAKEVCDEGRGVGPGGRGVYLDFSDAIARLGVEVIKERYGNLFDMYERITGENPYQVPMRIYPAIHYTMGGLWVDYNLMSNLPGLFVLGEANFSDHGANRLGASALMQGLADGYFVIPYTLADYLATAKPGPVTLDHPAFAASQADVAARTQRLLSVGGRRTVDDFHRELGTLMWELCGMSRSAAGLEKLIDQLPALREEFWRDVTVPGTGAELNQSLEKAGRVGDFMEMAELLAIDALHREESCGGHFREEYQTPEGEALRDDDHYAYVAGWEWSGEKGNLEPVTSGPLPTPVLHKEALSFEHVHFSQRSYQ